MEGTTGEYKTEYKSKKKAERAAENIRLLGYNARVEKSITASKQKKYFIYK
jgi:cell division protein FtsN